MENLNCFKSFDLPKRSNYDIHQMILQHQLITKDLAMKVFGIIINWTSIDMHYKRYNNMWTKCKSIMIILQSKDFENHEI